MNRWRYVRHETQQRLMYLCCANAWETMSASVSLAPSCSFLHVPLMVISFNSNNEELTVSMSLECNCTRKRGRERERERKGESEREF